MSLLLVALLASLVWSAVKLTRWVFADTTTIQQVGPQIPFGSLPALGPVGPIGNLSPDADLGSTASNPDELYGN